MASSKKTILIVDDDSVTLELLDFQLSMRSYNTLLARNAQTALEILKKQGPDCIVLDFHMPGVSGDDLCEQIKSNPRTQKIPIMFLSAFVQGDKIEQGFRAGASDYAFKPFKIDEVIQKIETLLRNSKSQ